MSSDPSAKEARKAANRRRHRRHRQAAISPASAPKSEINVTPFVDVVLVLLIIFMVVTPMLQRGKEVQLPASINYSKKKDTGEQIIVSVTESGAIYLGNDLVNLERLERQMAKLLQRKPVPPVFIKGDQRLTFAPIREVMEAVHRAGAAGVSLATEGKKK